MDVTVVVATRDRREQVLRTLPRHEAPVILVDNGSTDGTPDAVRRDFPQVTVLELGENRGAVARNAGVAAASTRYVAFADDDSHWEPGALELAERIFDRHPRLGLLAGKVLVGDERRIDPVSVLQAESPLETAPDLPGPSVLGFVGCGAVVRRAAFLGAGGFEPLLGIYGEEELLALDLAARGWGVAYVPDVVARHFPSPHRGSDRPRRRQQRRNELLTVWLRRSPRAVLAATAGSLVLARRDGDERAALMAAARVLPAVVRRRRRLPEHVERMSVAVQTARRSTARERPAGETGEGSVSTCAR